MRVDFPAPFSPTTACTSPGRDVEVDTVEDAYPEEGLADAAQIEQRCQRGF